MTELRSKIRPKAEELLAQAGVQGPAVPIERIARNLGVQIRREPFEGDISGLLVREDGRAIVGVNALHAKTRQRFTIAHELGHLVLHEAQDFHVDRNFRVLFRDPRSSQATDPVEIEANGFAAELLMPPTFLARDLRGQNFDFEDDERLRALARKYGVSLQAMIFRLANLGYMPQPPDSGA